MTEIRQTEVYRRWYNSLRDRQAKLRIGVRIQRLPRAGGKRVGIIAIVLADIAQAGGKSEIASDAGFTKERVERLSGNEPGFSELLNVIKSPGLQPYATAASDAWCREPRSR